jgi:beta-glucosidase
MDIRGREMNAVGNGPETSFPEGFFWGTATAAHQVEGNNINNDWWEWEHAPGTPCAEPSGDCCDHYHLYPQDIKMIASLGLQSYRFSVEWSRIEPREGEFSTAAILHYKRMVESCRENGIAAVPTLHHFTTPTWVAREGGWENPRTADLFARYCEQVVKVIGDDVERWCTINEPNMVSTIGYLIGQFPPGKQDRDARNRVNEVFCDAHRKSREVLKSHSTRPVGLTLAMAEFQVVGDGDDLVRAEANRQKGWDGLETPFLEVARGDDFFGVQTYTRERYNHKGRMKPDSDAQLTIMGYEYYPQALEATLRRAWEETGGVPIVVTENGIAVVNDQERIAYVTDALQCVLRCLADGIDIRGYMYWSLLDNFEWAYGYGPTFGLVAVDRDTQERSVKPSGHWLGEVARANRLLPAL